MTNENTAVVSLGVNCLCSFLISSRIMRLTYKVLGTTVSVHCLSELSEQTFISRGRSMICHKVGIAWKMDESIVAQLYVHEDRPCEREIQPVHCFGAQSFSLI